MARIGICNKHPISWQGVSQMFEDGIADADGLALSIIKDSIQDFWVPWIPVNKHPQLLGKEWTTSQKALVLLEHSAHDLSSSALWCPQ